MFLWAVKVYRLRQRATFTMPAQYDTSLDPADVHLLGGVSARLVSRLQAESERPDHEQQAALLERLRYKHLHDVRLHPPSFIQSVVVWLFGRPRVS